MEELNNLEPSQISELENNYGIQIENSIHLLIWLRWDIENSQAIN
jgi:hypothetical protein